MLKIKFREPESAHPLQALCPWIDFVTPGLVLNKDGSILAAFEYTGVDPDNIYDEKIDAVTAQLQSAFLNFDKRVTAWWIVDKRRDYTYPTNNFRNKVAEELDRLYAKSFRNGDRYSITYTLYFLFTGSTGADKFLDRVARIQAESGASMSSALMTAFRESMSNRKAFARDVGTIRENVHTFERLLTGFTSSAPLKFRRLYDDDFAQALATILNRASAPATQRKPKGVMLDAWAPTNYVACGPDVIRFQDAAVTVYAAALGVVRWPEQTTPMLFESLIAMDMEMTICQIVRFLDSQESSQEIEAAIEYYKLTQYGVLNHALSKAFGNTPDAKPGKAQLLDQCKDALDRIGTEGITYCYHNLTVFVYGYDQRELNRNVAIATQRMSNNRFAVIRERINAMPSFAAMLPGQWAMQTRYELLTIENAADCAPIYTIDEGPRRHPFFSDAIFMKEVPPFAVFGNAYSGRVNFSPHVGQVGHMLVVAPTGGGKTTFVNFCLSQFQRYGDVNTFVFDRNFSCRIVTELHHGRHVDIKSKRAGFNPLSAMADGTEESVLWVREFILRRFAEGGYEATTADRRDLDHALQMLLKSGQRYRLSTLAAILPMHLQDELGEWLEGRPYGMFDSEEDDFSITNWTTIEMREIMAVERLARAFMDYAFRKIDVSLDGRPTFIYLEEASFLLNNESFRGMIDDWLKTFRKKNAFVWMTIQSPESITHQEIAASILDNIFSFLFLTNEKIESHREGYKKNFALQDHQIDMIAALQPRREYLLVQGTDSRVIQTAFTPEVLAYLRSEETVQGIFQRHMQEGENGDPNWREKYLAAISTLR